MNRFRRLLLRLVGGAAMALPAAAALAGGFSATLGGAVIALGAAVALFGTGRAALFAGGTAVGAALALGAVALLPDAFYRPHERYALDDRYPPGLDVTETMPFGDLVALGGDAFAHAAEPRTVRFRTDGLGYRNDRDLGPNDVVIVGDSFVAGHSGDQADLLANKLAEALGGPVYGVGFPGDLAAYAERVRALGRPAWVFAFEGNDFIGTCSTEKPPPPLVKWATTQVRRKVPLFAKARAYTVRARTALRALTKDEADKGPGPVVEAALDGKPVLMLRAYADGTRRETFRLPDCAVRAMAEAAPLVRGLVFIPAKARVYDGLMSGATLEPLPHANWQALVELGEQTGIPVHDLTPALRDAALNAFARDGSLIFWRDDTHWNGRAAEAAARAMARIIEAGP